MRCLPDERFHRVLLLLFFLFFAGSCVAPPYVEYLLMQHVPTVMAAILLVVLAGKYAFSRLSFCLIIVFLSLHTLGARYLYTYTPYDAWSQQLFGGTISDTFGFERNHYDRLVHFSYGLLLVIPIQEFETRHLKLSRLLASVLAIECIVATSAGYEIIEWLIAVFFAPDWADQFLGQQGDPFDAQKDMALASGGAILAIIVSPLIPPETARLESTRLT